MTKPPAARETDSSLLDTRAVADLLRCSTRHVTRLRDAGRMPAAVRLGRLCRWPRAAIDGWVAAGCPPVPRPAGASAAD
jgi:excisionase family DNA binding protein